MLIVTGGNGVFEPLIKENRRRVNDLGYEQVIYDLGGLGFGTPFTNLAWGYKPSTRREFLRAKPICMRDARLHNRGPMLWMDGDCIMLRHFQQLDNVDAIFVGKRRKDGTLKVKVDVAYFNDTTSSELLLRQWTAMTPDDRSDRTFLNKLLVKQLGGPITQLGTLRLPCYRIELVDESFCYDVNDIGQTLPENLQVLHVKGRGKLEVERSVFKRKLMEHYLG